MMQDFSIQVLRYIHLRPGMSPRCMGLLKSDLIPVTEYIELSIIGYYGGTIRLSSKGIELLKSLDALRYGNPKWDDATFYGLMSRKSLNDPT